MDELNLMSFGKVDAIFNIQIKERKYFVIFGSHENGNFCCIPNWNYGSKMGAANNILYNALMLNKRFDQETAQILAESIQAAAAAARRLPPIAQPAPQEHWENTLLLSARARHCLHRFEDHPRVGRPLYTAEDVAGMTRTEIAHLPGAGKKTYEEIYIAIKKLGIPAPSWEQITAQKNPSI